MKEENFSLQSSLEGNYLNIALPLTAEVDEIAVRVMEEDCPDFLIPFRLVTVNGSTNLRYKLINTIALAYSDRNLSKQQFVKLFMDLLTPFMKGKDWFLDYHNLCIDPRYVFINKMNNGVSLIYVPENSYRYSDEEIKKFFKNLFTEITISDDPGFQVTMFRYFGNEDSNLADLYQILLQEQKKTGMGQTAVPQYATQTAAPSLTPGETAAQPRTVSQNSTFQTPPQNAGNMSQTAAASAGKPAEQHAKSGGKFSLFGGKKDSEPKKAADPGPAAAPAQNEDLFAGLGDMSDSDAAVNALFGDNSKKKKEKEKKEKDGGFSLFGGKKKEQNATPAAPAQATTARPQNTSAQQPVMQQAPAQQMATGGFPGGGFQMMSAAMDESTEIAGEDYRGGACLELIESAVPGAIPRISLDFAGPFITIGRTSSDETQPDVAFSKDFSRIGRKHARIERSGSGYCIIDLGSANHTLVNNQVLIPNQPYPLPDGGEVTFTTTKPVKYRIHL